MNLVNVEEGRDFYALALKEAKQAQANIQFVKERILACEDEDELEQSLADAQEARDLYFQKIEWLGEVYSTLSGYLGGSVSKLAKRHTQARIDLENKLRQGCTLEDMLNLKQHMDTCAEEVYQEFRRIGARCLL